MQLSTKGKSGAGDVNSVFCALGGDPSSKGSTVSAEHVQDLLAREFEVRAPGHRRRRREARTTARNTAREPPQRSPPLNWAAQRAALRGMLSFAHRTH